MSTRRLTCPCGNTWEQPLDEPVPADGRLICPACTLASRGTREPARHSVLSDTIATPDAPPAPSAKPELPVGPGRIIAGFEIIEEINRGGMGIIYKARQLAMNRLVALKV